MRSRDLRKPATCYGFRGVDAIVAGQFTRDEPAPGALNSAAPTFREFAEDWTSGALHKQWPDHVKEKRSVSDDEYRLEAQVYPVVGDIPLNAFTMDHAEAVMRALPAHLSAASRRHIAQLIHRVIALAVYPRTADCGEPTAAGLPPEAW